MTQPNVLCVSIDSLRADYTSLSEDCDHETTPTLASLAEESTVFSSAISPSIWTLPVHTSVFTGLFPPEHGILAGGRTLGDHPTFAELLAEQGYSTQAFYLNSWFDTGEILRGFGISRDDPEESSMRSVADIAGAISPRIEAFLERSYNCQERYRNWALPDSWDRPDVSGDRRTVDRASEAVSDIEPPFCWFVHLNDAHYRYGPPSPHHDAFTDRSATGLLYNYERWQHRVYDRVSTRLKTGQGEIRPPEREVETFKDLYRGAIRHCDSLLDELIDRLKEAGEWENTILVVFGDHGDSFGENEVFGHQFSVDDSLIRVPLLVRDPTDTLNGGTVTTPASLVDIYPTLLSLTDTDGPETEGIDLSTETREYAYTHYDATDCHFYVNLSDDLDEDRIPPVRQRSIWASSDRKVVVYPDRDEFGAVGDEDGTLRRQLERHTEGLERIPTSTEVLDDGVTERLKDMGYVE